MTKFLPTRIKQIAGTEQQISQLRQGELVIRKRHILSAANDMSLNGLLAQKICDIRPFAAIIIE
ncbi:hypothetical protein IPC80_20720 [Pseudomonas aeruginosa]|nr:hypothetical protein BFV99_33235 [Pseudomonas aeruginosa]OFB92225.1 hypothetical protein AN473_08465 [Pseudomonas aeruginosa]OFB94947.1 hypothetical protein AN472_12420 [Pseudomonas aeruginosa]OFC20613.1 hypothetical protein AN465_11165 [Pseudomonas aeruginosa]OFC26570.1 hypothetical protein AN464_32330 [Pseudomonas aeruginosa]